VPNRSQRNIATNAEKTPEGTNGEAIERTTTVASETTEADGTTTVASETTEAGKITGTVVVNNVARSTTTTGPAPSAKTPISLSETYATDAKHRVLAVAGTEGNTTTAADGTTTVASEATVADETTKVVVVNNVGPSTTTIGRAPSVRTPIFHSETSATVAKSPVLGAVVDEATAGSHPVVTRRGTTNDAATKEANSVEGLNRAGVILDHSRAEPQMFSLEEREESDRGTRTTNLHEISDLHGNLSEGKTERA